MKNTNYFEKKLLHSFFIDSAVKYPEAYALSILDKKWTYGEVEHQARCWANLLLQAKKQKVFRVGIFASRSYIAYVGILASLFAGATYVPLNYTFPLERTISMIKQAELDAIIVDGQSFEQLRNIIPYLEKEISILSPGTPDNSAWPSHIHFYNKQSLEALSPLKELPNLTEESAAYLLFTSGSTGQPKGVAISHGNVSSFLEYNIAKYQFTPEDRCTQTFDLTFDLSVFDLFMTWGSGACLCVMQPIEKLAPFRFLQKNNVTVWFSVPSVIALYCKKQILKKNCLPTLKWSLFCGEALPKSYVEAWQEAAPQSLIENLYGPTELTIACSAYRWDKDNSPDECVNGVVPIGRVYEHLSHVVVDEKLNRVNDGAEGELCVSGPQMFHGYLNNSEQSSKSLVQINSATYYRTGDLVRYENNNYIYLGRIDSQIKIQGYRIELGEIESVIRRHTNVVETAAVTCTLADDETLSIVVFVNGTNINVDEINQVCKKHLPSYMCPRKICVLNDIPYNSNGKIDRNALRAKISEVIANE